MNIKLPKINERNKPVLQVFALSLIVFFLIMTLLTAFVLSPRINESFEKQHREDSEAALEIEAELFHRFVENHRTILQDLANYPIVTSTALLSQADNTDFIDLVDNFSISGEKSRLILQDIAGNIIYTTTNDLKGNFSPDEEWIKDILNGTTPFHFRLLGQENNSFRFIISIPVMYRNNVEGLLSAEITAPIEYIFSKKALGEDSAFTLKQNNVTVKIATGSINHPHTISTVSEDTNIEITYTNDFSKVTTEQNKLRNMTLVILFFGLAISFIFFSILAYGVLMADEDHKGYKNSIFSKSYTFPLVIGSIGIAASISAFFIIQDLKEKQILQETLAANNIVIESIEESLTTKANTLYSLKAYYDSSQYIDRIEFKTFTAPFFDEHSDIQALEWIPKVTADQREYYEELAREDGLTNYSIKELTVQGILETAPIRDVHYPVYYAEPYEPNKKVLGLDAPLNLKRVQAIQQATDTGHITAAGTFPLYQDKENKTGLLIFNPVYNDAPNYINTRLRREKLKGLVLLVLRIEDVISPILKESKKDISIYLEDVTDPQNPELFFGEYNENSIQPRLISNKTIDIFGRLWNIGAYPSSNPFTNISSLLPWFILFGGLIFTIFTTYTFIQLVRRKEITEQIVADQTKEVKELSSAMENAVEGVSQLNYKGNYVYLNESYANTCGYAPAQLIGENWRKTIHPDDYEMMNDAYMAMFDHGQVTVEPRAIRKDGSTFHKRVTMIARYSSNGEFIGHHCFMSDITDRKKAEQEILNSNAELEEFAYRTSHDLRSPIISSIRLLGMAEKSIRENKTDFALTSLAHAQGSLKKLDTLIKDILSLTETKNKEEIPTEVNVPALVEDALEKMEHMDGFDRLDIKTSFNFNDVLRVKESRLNMILENLISNAIKYQDPQEEAPYVKISTRKTNNSFVLKVEDNGLGIPKEQQEKLFTMFKRFHPKIAFGSGLGLYLMKKSADILGGEIAFEEPEKGSIFKLTIPL